MREGGWDGGVRVGCGGGGWLNDCTCGRGDGGSCCICGDGALPLPSLDDALDNDVLTLSTDFLTLSFDALATTDGLLSFPGSAGTSSSGVGTLIDDTDPRPLDFLHIFLILFIGFIPPAPPAFAALSEAAFAACRSGESTENRLACCSLLAPDIRLVVFGTFSAAGSTPPALGLTLSSVAKGEGNPTGKLSQNPAPLCLTLLLFTPPPPGRATGVGLPSS